MESYKYTQKGYFTIISIVPVLIFIIVITLLSGFDDPVFTIIMVAVAAIFLICLIIFHKLTITIDQTHISMSFGPGLFKKKFALSDIESCRPVKNPLWYGIGIRLTPDGWLYNVSGRYAIELALRNRKSKIRVGTDRPEEISGIICNLIGRSSQKHDFEYANKRGYYIFLALILTVLIFPAFIIIYGSKDVTLTYSDYGFRIEGLYGMEIKYHEIAKIDTLSSLPRIKTRTNGLATSNTLKGNFRLYDNTKAKLFIKKNTPPYIFIRAGENVIYLNFSNPEVTKSDYEKISAACSKNE